MGIQRIESMTIPAVDHRPTLTSVRSEASGFIFLKISMVISVEHELNTALSEDMRAASRAAIIMPASPGGMSRVTMRG